MGKYPWGHILLSFICVGLAEYARKLQNLFFSDHNCKLQLFHWIFPSIYGFITSFVISFSDLHWSRIYNKASLDSVNYYQFKCIRDVIFTLAIRTKNLGAIIYCISSWEKR